MSEIRYLYLYFFCCVIVFVCHYVCVCVWLLSVCLCRLPNLECHMSPPSPHHPTPHSCLGASLFCLLVSAVFVCVSGATLFTSLLICGSLWLVQDFFVLPHPSHTIIFLPSLQKKKGGMETDDFRACLISMGYDVVITLTCTHTHTHASVFVWGHPTHTIHSD